MNIESFVYNLALGLPGLLLAVVFHEYAHAYMALRFGDPTAKLAGRLTMNPLAHLDLLGSVIMPIVGALIGGVMFGWAKPVPIQSRYFDVKRVRKAIFWVSFAGPLANGLLMVISAFIAVMIAHHLSPDFYLYAPLIKIFTQSVYVNTILGAFNLIPIPPLDGSKMAMSFMNYNMQLKYQEIARYSFVIFLLLIFTGVTRYIFLPAVILAESVLGLFSAVL